jgi:integrase
MPGKQAKVVTPQMLRRMMRRTSTRPFPARDRVMILLSIKAGLRACEMARLEWSMVLDALGKVADTLAIHDAIAKKRGGRRIPMHPDLRHALRSLLRISEPFGPVIRSARGGCLRPTSVRDVQLLAGHRSIETTERYIDGDTRGQRRLVGLL